MFIKSLIIGLLLLSAIPVTFSQQSKNLHRHVFCQKIKDTLINNPVKNIIVYSFIPVKQRTVKNKPDSIGKKLKQIDTNKISSFIAFLEDSSNFLNADISRSCAFLPQYYFQLIVNGKKKIYILLSYNCEQVAMTNEKFKKASYFADLNDKGMMAINKYLKEQTQ